MPIIGLRSWRVEPGGTLRSLTRRVPWPDDAPLVAGCTWPEEAERMGAATDQRYTTHSEGDTPFLGCACGIYLRTWPIAHARSRDHLPEMTGPVVGFAALWGKVIGDRGTGIHRGQYAVPLAICTRYCYDQLLAPVAGFPPGVVDVQAVAERYAVPLSGDLDDLHGLAQDEMVRRMLASARP